MFQCAVFFSFKFLNRKPLRVLHVDWIYSQNKNKKHYVQIDMAAQLNWLCHLKRFIRIKTIVKSFAGKLLLINIIIFCLFVCLFILLLSKIDCLWRRLKNKENFLFNGCCTVKWCTTTPFPCKLSITWDAPLKRNYYYFNHTIISYCNRSIKLNCIALKQQIANRILNCFSSKHKKEKIFILHFIFNKLIALFVHNRNV